MSLVPKNFLILFALLFSCAAHHSSLAQAEKLNPEKYDEFLYVSCEDMIARLDGYAYKIYNQPTEQAYVIIYGGRVGRRGEMNVLRSIIKAYLIKARGVEAKRIVVVQGGYREKMTVELWYSEPNVNPSATPTVDAKMVRLKGWVRASRKSFGDICNVG